jgi:hypothetical protein
MNHLSTDPFDLNAVRQAVNQASSETARKISFLFAQSICAFFHKHPEAVLSFITAKQLALPDETYSDQLYISRIDTQYVQSTCHDVINKGLVPDAGFLYGATARRFYKKAMHWVCPVEFNNPFLEKRALYPQYGPLPVPLSGVSNANKVGLLNMFQPFELRPWLRDCLSIHSPIASIVEGLTCSMNETTGAALYLNRHSIPSMLLHFHNYEQYETDSKAFDFLSINAQVESLALSKHADIDSKNIMIPRHAL